MYTDLNEIMVNSSKNKVEFLTNEKVKYFVSSMLAGLYVGLGILLIFTIGGLMGTFPATRIFMGVSFGIALSLVVMLGSELFTGNNMLGFGGFLNKAITLKELLSMWLISWAGNFLGGILLAVVYFYSQAGNQKIIDFMIKASVAKAAPAPAQLFLRGVLCNILVCLAVMSSAKLKEETARLIMVFWCLFAFITTGFEHSVANMTLLTVGFLAKGLSMAALVKNMFFVSIGNIVGGSLLAFAYYILRKRVEK